MSDITDPCPACKAAAGEPCVKRIGGVDMGWTHDARILAPIIRDIETTKLVPALSFVAPKAEDLLANVRKYATLTLDSVSVERRGMAEDILSLIDGDA